MQERNTARLSERLTLAEEAASLARSDAAESASALSAMRAENSAQQEGGSELRGQLTALSTKIHELQGLVDAAKEEAGAASHAVAVSAAKDVTISREQVRPHRLSHRPTEATHTGMFIFSLLNFKHVSGHFGLFIHAVMRTAGVSETIVSLLQLLVWCTRSLDSIFLVYH